MNTDNNGKNVKPQSGYRFQGRLEPYSAKVAAIAWGLPYHCVEGTIEVLDAGDSDETQLIACQGRAIVSVLQRLGKRPRLFLCTSL